jgi:hypothetical protein
MTALRCRTLHHRPQREIDLFSAFPTELEGPWGLDIRLNVQEIDAEGRRFSSD